LPGSKDNDVGTAVAVAHNAPAHTRFLSGLHVAGDDQNHMYVCTIVYGRPSRNVPVGYRAGTGDGNCNRPYAASANSAAVGARTAAGWLLGAQPTT
jgi:hypothetical protein